MRSWFHKRAKHWWSEHFPPAIPASLGYTAPTGETEYLIDPSVFHEGHDVFRETAVQVTRALLDTHPRQAAEIAIEAEPYVMPNYEPEAYNRLVEAGMTVETENHFWGESAETRPLTPISATSRNVEDCLALFPYTNKAVVVDEDGQYLLNYYESGGSYRLWLPDAHIDCLKDQLNQNASAAIRRGDYWEGETDE